jgi:hypothetical protein
MLPLISYAATQAKYDGSGGSKNTHNRVLEKTLAEISEKAAHDAYFYGLLVEYKTQDGSMVLQAFPDYGKSKCNLVHEKPWEHGKMVVNTIKEVCDRNYQGIEPYGDIFRSTPSIPSVK